jgi:hypothetical protein
MITNLSLEIVVGQDIHLPCIVYFLSGVLTQYIVYLDSIVVGIIGSSVWVHCFV